MRAIRDILIVLCLFISTNGYTQDNKGAEAKPISMDSLFKAKERESIGRPFPAFTSSFNGNTITKDSLRGKIVFLNFWFETCPPCIAELPSLNELFTKFSPYKNFEFISFTYESPAKIRSLKKKYHIKYKVASVNRQECYRLNQNNGFPTSIILDGNGTIINLFTGGYTDRKKVEDLFKTTIYKSLSEALKPN